MAFNSDKNKNVRFGNLEIYYHQYQNSPYWTRCDTSDNVSLDCKIGRYSIYSKYKVRYIDLNLGELPLAKTINSWYYYSLLHMMEEIYTLFLHTVNSSDLYQHVLFASKNISLPENEK